MSSVWELEPPGRRSALSREAIVRAAVHIADTEGLEAVSIRRVAAALDARAMSLYTYIRSKDDLLLMMTDQIAAEVLVEEPLPKDWRAAISLIVRNERLAAGRHLWYAELLGQVNGPFGPNAVRHMEQTLAAVSSMDMPLSFRLRVIAAVDAYSHGLAMADMMREERGAGRTRVTLEQPFVQRLVADGGLPHLREALAEGAGASLTDRNLDAGFEAGLAWLLDGIEAEVQAARNDRDRACTSTRPPRTRRRDGHG